MSAENVQFIRDLIGAYQRADFEALAEGGDDDFEFTSVLTAVEETTYRGKDAWRGYFADMDETWEDWTVEIVDAVDAGDDSVVVVTRLTGKGRASGAPVDRTIGIVYTLRNGKAWRMRSYLDPADALAAAGMPPA